jgi:hypothetical protein
MMEASIQGMGITSCGELELRLSVVGSDGVEHIGTCWVSREFVLALVAQFEPNLEPEQAG